MNEQQQANVARYLRAAVTAAFAALIAYQVSLIAATFREPRVVLPAVAHSVEPVMRARPGRLDALPSAHLFGVAPSEPALPVESIADVPPTTLALTLTGVLAGRGEAVIASNGGREVTYATGDVVDGAGGLALHSVYADHVLLAGNGRLEKLAFANWDAPGLRASIADNRDPSSGEQAARASTRSGSERASSMLGSVSMPSDVQGLRVKPTIDGAQMRALGLRSDDVIVGMEPAVAADDSSPNPANPDEGLVVTVVRDGVPHNIVVDGSQVANLRGSLE